MREGDDNYYEFFLAEVVPVLLFSKKSRGDVMAVKARTLD